MSVSRRGLFGLLAVAPVAAVKAAHPKGIDERIADIEALMSRDDSPRSDSEWVRGNRRKLVRKWIDEGSFV